MSRFVCLLLLIQALPLQAAQPPSVVLSAQHKKMCKVGVGDAIESLGLVDPKGKERSLTRLLGKQATVVAIVGRPHFMSMQLLADLPRDVSQKYGKQGVESIVITTGRRPNANEVNAAYQLLSDPAGKQFAQLGHGKLPRVYVLDGKGKIVWFDIEYSRSTRRELRQTLAAMTGKKR